MAHKYIFLTAHLSDNMMLKLEPLTTGSVTVSLLCGWVRLTSDSFTVKYCL